MNHLVTKKYKGYTYHVEANGDFIIVSKTHKGKYIPFTRSCDPKEMIDRIIRNGDSEYIVWDRSAVLRDAEMIATELEYVKTH